MQIAQSDQSALSKECGGNLTLAKSGKLILNRFDKIVDLFGGDSGFRASTHHAGLELFAAVWFPATGPFHDQKLHYFNALVCREPLAANLAFSAPSDRVLASQTRLENPTVFFAA